MASHFFTNQKGDELQKKFKGIFNNYVNLYAFHAVVGYFRASGYHAIREHLLKLGDVKILVGINVDHMIAEAKRRGLMFMGDPKKTREEFVKWMQEDIKDAEYSKKVEEGILLFMEDIIDGKIEIRAHKKKNLHAKIYIFLPEDFHEDAQYSVITGSSNLTHSGLGNGDEDANYEFNVELKRYDDVKFAESEFQKLWADGEEILPEDIQKAKKDTHIGKEFTPFELYIKFLIEYFGKNIDYDPETVGDVPKQFMKLSYQIDAVNQGFQMLEDYNGFFLADVVGTGKTVVAAMLAKRFIIANGTGDTKILVVYPPALAKNWKRTFRLFGIDKYAKFITNGSLHKIVEDRDLDYWPKEDYDLVIVDEAHKFRNKKAQMFENLQIICKAGRYNNGLINSEEKKVVLVSATPLNNRPEDIYNMIQLFQDARRSDLPVTNLTSYFYPRIKRYEEIMKRNEPDIEAIRELYADIREKILKPITIRRTRRDLENVDQYREDLKKQGVVFPDIAKPRKREYELGDELRSLFFESLDSILDEDKIGYYRYQAIKYLDEEIKDEYYETADLTSRQLARMMTTLLVKRLESSFKAFKDTLHNLRDSTANMIRTYENGKVFVAPDLDVNRLMDEGLTDDEIEMKILSISDEKPGNRTFEPDDFRPEFIEGLRNDLQTLDALCDQWDDVDQDPKFNKFLDMLENELLDRSINPSGKLVIFSEAKSTIEDLTKKLKEHGYDRVLTVSADNRSRVFEEVLANFDANYEGEVKDEYDIIITTEVLAEGVNLHRANVIVNYDTPWNATRLMQRIGRVNRIGTRADTIYNYNFYPSDEGDMIISLKKKALVKLQSFHSAFGEDSQIYSLDEVIEEFELYKEGQKDDEDIRLKYLEFIRNFKENNIEDFRRIKRLPLKARTLRFAEENDQGTVCFLRTDDKKELYYISKDEQVVGLNFEEAVNLFEATEKEEPLGELPNWHYEHINWAKEQYQKDIQESTPEGAVTEKKDARYNRAARFLKDIKRYVDSDQMDEVYRRLKKLMDEGTYANLLTEITRVLNKKAKPSISFRELKKIADKYSSRLKFSDEKKDKEQDQTLLQPEIIISESFK
ncbi:phospholipase D-like domain-containing protein [Aliifodinibius sp. S!AR15-10]|uniref:helicase-related protein n=1 Tax=Aliifodinibius sp. S!AR15-10 TaxID=2950437 RepID=UPI00285D6912|nr:helicase-related protein [Aliifodinibius sp. S!AR15-10]MDR8392243.1 phospholipase D-like domain-containing protein [Aliifodinibius sp. S!AR15-10]